MLAGYAALLHYIATDQKDIQPYFFILAEGNVFPQPQPEVLNQLAIRHEFEPLLNLQMSSNAIYLGRRNDSSGVDNLCHNHIHHLNIVLCLF